MRIFRNISSKGYESFTVAYKYYQDGKRKREVLSDFARAKKRAKKVAEVALEAGNSPDIIFQHYRELVTGEAAKLWFGITPAVVKAEAVQLKEEGARLPLARAEAEEAKQSKRRGRKKADAGVEVQVPAGATIVAFPARVVAA